MDPKKLCTVFDLAAIFTCHPETIRRWYRTGKIPVAYRGGRTLHFDLDDVLKALRRKGAA